MKNYARLTPEGTRDTLFDAVDVQNFVEGRLRKFFKCYGFQEVRTPGFEFYDVFGATGKYFPPESMYKLSDHRGRLIVVRPDSTIPIARLVATKLPHAPMPLRISYDQTVYRTSRNLDGISHEMRQMGVELIGAGGEKSELEMVAMACAVFDEIGLEDYRVEIGHVGVFKALMNALGADEERQDEIFCAVEEKNYSALNDALLDMNDDVAAALLKQLPRLFGGREVLNEARALLADFSDEVTDALDALEDLYSRLEDMRLDEHILIDFGLVNQADYYTGLVFRGYVGGAGTALLSGGRYDRLMADFGLDLPAIGFGVRMDLLAEVLLRRTPRMRQAPVLLYADLADVAQALVWLRRDGRCAELSMADSLEDAMADAARRGAREMLYYRNGATVVLEVQHA